MNTIPAEALSLFSLFKLYRVRRRRQLGRLLWCQVFGQPNKNRTEYFRFGATTTTEQMARVQLTSRLCSCHSARTHSPTTFNSLNVAKLKNRDFSFPLSIVFVPLILYFVLIAASNIREAQHLNFNCNLFWRPALLTCHLI